MTDGASPTDSLVQGTDGNFYGTTLYGGGNYSVCPYGCGTVFKITPAGTLTTLHDFGGADGANPYSRPLQGSDGNFYGTTFAGGSHNLGTVYKMTPSGTLTTLHSFDTTDGAYTFSGLVQAPTGDFYGTTYTGGTSDLGTVFRISSGLAFTTLYNFDSANGGEPYAGPDGRFYGTAKLEGTNLAGSAFRMASDGTFQLLHTFDFSQGGDPEAPLVQATNGSFYGTSFGGTDGCGTVFRLSVGLGPFVATLPAFGEIGSSIKILGTGLTNASSVTFNGISTTYAIHSGTLIIAKVPAGATIGPVQVVTPSGTLTSNVDFQVE